MGPLLLEYNSSYERALSTHDKLSFRDNDEGDVRCLYLGSVCFTLSSLFMHFLSLPKRYQNLKGMDTLPPLGLTCRNAFNKLDVISYQI